MQQRLDTLRRYRQLLREYIQDVPELNKLIEDLRVPDSPDLPDGEMNNANGLEAQDSDLDRAIIKALDKWNAILPPIGAYTLDNFPCPGMIIDGAVIENLKSMIHRKFRNQLPYSDAGFSADEDGQGQTYFQYLNYLSQEYMQLVKDWKKAYNISKCFGGVPSEYSLLYYSDIRYRRSIT